MTCTYRRSKPGTKSNSLPNLEQAINEFFNTALGEVAPSETKRKKGNIPTNVIKYDDRFELQMSLPGLDKEDVQLDIDKNLMHVTTKLPERSIEGTYKLKEFFLKEYKKTFHLPEKAEISSIDARFSAGVLTITIPFKKEAIPAPPKQIKIL